MPANGVTPAWVAPFVSRTCNQGEHAMADRSLGRRHFLLDEKATPILNALISRAQASSHSAQEQGFFALDDIFSEFMNSGELQKIVNHEITVMRDNPGYAPKGSAGSSLLLYESEKIALTAIGLDKNTSSDKIFSIAGNALLGNMGPGPLKIRLHEIPASCRPDVFDASQRLHAKQEIELAVHGIVKIDADKVVPEYLLARKTILVKLTAEFHRPLIWIYDRATGVPQFTSSGSLSSSRLQATINLLNALESDGLKPSRESIDNLAQLADHPFHFVRWAAIQGLCKLDFSVGKHHLVAAQNDRHPHIARAATNSVGKLKSSGSLI
jgi:hypothetical protein